MRLEYIDKFSDEDDIADVWAGTAASQNELSKYPEVLTSCENALKIDSKNVLALQEKGKALEAQKKYPEAIECFENCNNLDPEHRAFFLTRIISCCKKSGDRAKQEEYEEKRRDYENDDGT